MWGSFKFRWKNCKTWTLFYNHAYRNKYAANFSVCLRKKPTCFFSTSHASTEINSKQTTQSVVDQVEEDQSIRDEFPSNNNRKRKRLCPIPSKYKIKVPHEEVVASLLTCHSAQEQINKFCDTLKLSKEEIEERIGLTQYLQDALRPFFPECQVMLTGSSISGFGIKGCDIDLSLDIQWDESYVQNLLGKLPSVAEVEDDTVPLSLIRSFKPLYQLRFARLVLMKYTSIMPIYVLKGRCPILQFPYGPHNLSCDLSFGNRSAVGTTKLQIMCCKLDERVVPLTVIVNYWAKHNSLIQASKFKSYAFSMMVIYFLQTRSPPILPPLKDILKDDLFNCDDAVNCDIGSSMKLEMAANTQSTTELLREFFFFYLFFDFDQVICPLTGTTANKMTSKFSNETDMKSFQLSSICIQDPIDISWNVTTGAQFKDCAEFLTYVLTTCKFFQRDECWQSERNGCWGLAEVLSKKAGTYFTDDSFSVSVPFSENESAVNQIETTLNAFLNIFSVALMFECVLVKKHMDHLKVEHATICDSWRGQNILRRYFPGSDGFTNSHDISTHLCTIHCNVHNCWKGRNLHALKNIPKVELLKVEHSVTKQILNDCDDKSSFQFLCEFYVKDYLLDAKFKSIPGTHFPQKFLVFMREYVPLAVQKLLK